ncbi:hypothetical protein FG91_00830 [Sphingopyxis sp. LC81]|uniref:hypothetical protein n=1 Tax=Sphingopyxis sp. LC81 TaxID=1502850 RepID=UPI00050E3D21|nr:hypothetical protein [Sphingopyxis sp. LC81]KGB55946.1 hypothetical protein FG91_00830 [Sphingopyxis sp. LC81]
MILEREQDMTTPPFYSQFFACLHDQAGPVGHIGRGTHHSVFRSIQWRDIDGDFRDSGRIHDFAVIWDEDHDTRVVEIAEQLHMAGLLWPVVFIGERKGMLTLLLWAGVDPTKERADWFELVEHLADTVVENDVWNVEIGRFERDPANRRQLTEPAEIIAGDDSETVAYLQAIDLLWQLGEKKRSSYSPIVLSDDDAARLTS